MDYQPFLIAFAVFVCVYAFFFLIRVFADMILVGIALICAFAAYSIEGLQFYPEYREVLMELGVLNYLGLTLPAQPNTGAVLVICFFIVLGGVMLCLPVLPFSATYRYMLGVERLTSEEERRIKRWVQEEIERNEEERFYQQE